MMQKKRVLRGFPVAKCSMVRRGGRRIGDACGAIDFSICSINPKPSISIESEHLV